MASISVSLKKKLSFMFANYVTQQVLILWVTLRASFHLNVMENYTQENYERVPNLTPYILLLYSNAFNKINAVAFNGFIQAIKKVSITWYLLYYPASGFQSITNKACSKMSSCGAFLVHIL